MKSFGSAFLLAVLAGLFLAGCRGESPTGEPGPWTHAIRGNPAYYESGPQQGRPPEGNLAAGTRVNLIREQGSYSLVEAESGESGYVSSDSLEPLR